MHSPVIVAPVWLADEPEIQSLLAAVVDRFDRQSGEARERAIVLPVASLLPSLEKNDDQADQLWAWINELASSGVLQIRQARRNPYDSGWHGAKLAFPPASEHVLRAWLDRAPAESAMLQWRRAVEQHSQRFPGDVSVLLSRRIVIDGRSPAAVVDALARLGEVTQPATLRQLSALAFWGDSKVLDERADLVAALFPQLPVRERPIVVAAHLPETMTAVLFIENQDTYTAAVDGIPEATRNHALVYIAGFKGTALRIRSAEGARLHFAGVGVHRETFEAWWFERGVGPLPTLFWGDLDFSGMQILKSLRARFGDTQAWEPGYLPMLANLRARGANPAAAREIQRQIDPVATGCDFADHVLLPAIRTHGFLHQEHPGTL